MSKISVTTIAGLTSGGDANTVKIESGDTLAVQSNATVGGTLGVTGATTATGGVTIPASTTVGLNFGSGTDLAQLAMQSGVSDRIALRTTHTSTGDNNPLIIYQPSGAGAQNDALVVNTGGQVTKSKIPAFLARYNGTATNLDTETWVFNSTSINDGYNNGGHYSTSNGRFTAPVAGRYNIHFSTIVNTQATNMTMQLRKNGSVLDQMHLSQDEGGWNTYHLGGVYNLSANDYVTVYIAAAYQVYGQSWSRFTGCLVG